MSEPVANVPDPSALLDLLDALVPSGDAHSIEDIHGNVYALPAALPARRQIAVMRALEPLKDAATRHPALRALFAPVEKAASDAQGDEPTEGAGEGTPAPRASLLARLGAALRAIADDESVLKTVEDAFTAAHPSVVLKARTATLTADGAIGGDEQGPADLFALEELVGGLLPFFVQLARSVAAALGTASKVAPKKP